MQSSNAHAPNVQPHVGTGTVTRGPTTNPIATPGVGALSKDSVVIGRGPVRAAPQQHVPPTRDITLAHAVQQIHDASPSDVLAV